MTFSNDYTQESSFNVQDRAQRFHEVFGHPVLNAPTMNAPKRGLHRVVMREEYMETENANDQDDLVEFADGLADLVWTAYATAIGHGIDLQKIIPLVAMSNMSKLGEDGNPVYHPNGKIKKGPNYFPPTELIKKEIARQQSEGTYK